MVKIHLETDIAATIEDVFDLARDIDFHQRSMADTREEAVGGRTSGLIGPGETVTWRARHFGRTWSLTSTITEFERPTRFIDEQSSGPFAWFRHEHRFEVTPGGTRMIDDWEHKARSVSSARSWTAWFLVPSSDGFSTGALRRSSVRRSATRGCRSFVPRGPAPPRGPAMSARGRV